MQVFDLRGLLQPILTPYLGIYTLPNGQTRPAIRIVPPRVPSEYKVSGIECIIQRNPDQIPKATSSGEVLINQRWSVRLTQFNRDDIHVNQLQEAKLVVMQTFPDCGPVHVPQTDVNNEQVTFKIQDYAFVAFRG